MFALQNVPPPRSDDVQPVSAVAQHFSDAAAVKRLQALTKRIAHLLCTHAFLAWQRFVMLVDVIVFKPFKGRHRAIETSGGHAPRANRCAHQINRLVTLWQPFTKDEAVERSQNQPFGSACRSRNDANVLRPQAVFTDVRQGFRTRIDMKGSHGHYFLRFCNLAKALAIADPVAAGAEAYPPLPRCR